MVAGELNMEMILYPKDMNFWIDKEHVRTCDIKRSMVEIYEASKITYIDNNGVEHIIKDRFK
jgi:hypothetical protein